MLPTLRPSFSGDGPAPSRCAFRARRLTTTAWKPIDRGSPSRCLRCSDVAFTDYSYDLLLLALCLLLLAVGPGAYTVLK